MHSKRILFILFCAVSVSQYPGLSAQADVVGVHCQIDGAAFTGDADVTRIDYVIPPGGKPPRFRLLTGHSDDALGFISVELKATGAIAVGSSPLSQEPTWKSVVKFPKKQDSAVTGGDFSFTHFDPRGDSYASGTVQFQTVNAHRGQCRFRLPMVVVDLGHTLR